MSGAGSAGVSGGGVSSGGVSGGAALRVVQPGLLATLQDLGRFGAQELGMPVAGAIDPLALRLANALVGNPQQAGALEIGYLGPTLEVVAQSARVAVVGPVALGLSEPGDPAERPLAPGRSHLLREGARLRIGPVDGMAYAYLAVEGGFAAPPFMGSQSTYLRAGLGGFAGRSLAAGDLLALARPAASARGELAAGGPLPYGEGPVRVVLGPQDDLFTAEALQTFLSADYTVTKEADRMGLRLDGPRLAHKAGPDIVSDGIATGCIQVPGSGQPIVLLADHQTIGGYAKIAAVASADLPRLGQLTPGRRLRFAAIDVAAAEALRRQQEAAFGRLVAGLAPPRPAGGIDTEALARNNLITGAIDALADPHRA